MAIMVPTWMLRGCIHCQVFSKFIDLVFFIVFLLVNIKQSNDYCCLKKKINEKSISENLHKILCTSNW